MAMKNPPHPGQTIGDSLEEMGVSVSEAAKTLAGRSAITPEMAFRLETALGSTADAWLRLQANYDLSLVRARAGAIKVGRLVPKSV